MNCIRIVVVFIVILSGLVGFTAPSTKVTLATASIEASLGDVLAKPVMQCGTGVESVTDDGVSGSVTMFESGPVRPIALSADGKRLYVANRPAHCLEIYAVEGDTLKLASSVAVGLEPVAVAERSADEVWVVNHLSDSVSVVRLDGTPRVLRTLQVGDEPRDIVFAGPNRQRAFITAAMRGQNRPGVTTATLTTPGIGRADVWVFDAANLDESLNGKPLTILTMFADTPRALAVSADGETVYAAPFHSGNQTTVLHRDSVLFRKPGPQSAVSAGRAPDTGLIVKYDGSAWRDEANTNWSNEVKLSLPDYDVFAIDASAPMPTLGQRVSKVGTTLFNMAAHPSNGKLYVTNTEAINEVRFEGPGTPTTSTVRGRAVQSRVSVVDLSAGQVDAVNLNPHVDFNVPEGAVVSEAISGKSLATPTALTFSPDGATLYVAALGSAKVVAIATASLSGSGYVPDAAAQISVGAGPAGLAINATGSRLFVLSHIAHQIDVVDTANKRVVYTKKLFTPDNLRSKVGRRFLYDAKASSANGTQSCAGCHTFGDMDHLAWDLGDPTGRAVPNVNAYLPGSPKTTFNFHPMKGPMTTQTLRGMAGNGPTHWRGDRTGTNRAVVRGALESLEAASFKEFNPAFVGLLGNATPLSAKEMQAFTDFALGLKMPPNPIRALDNKLNSTEAAGQAVYMNVNSITGLGSCNNCHTVNPTTGKFGSNGLMTFEGFRITENFKVPQLRNMYQKLGMFGAALTSSTNTGPQIRGFGFSNDGTADTLTTFFSDPVFNFPAPATTTRDQVIAFTLAMDSDLRPMVGQQVTLRPSSTGAELVARFSQMKAQANAGACELVVRGAIDGTAHAGLLQRDGAWQMRAGNVLIEADLLALAKEAQPLTFTCMPNGDGKRAALNGGPVAANAVVEFYIASLDQYFMTADSTQLALIEASPEAGLSRTGFWFKTGGSTPVCRFYGSPSPGPNTHFYTAQQSDCDLLRDIEARTPATQPRLNFEGYDFATTPPTNGACPANLQPIYRAYNNGHLRGIDGNHRFSADRSAIAAVVARGWVDEGVVMCAPR